MGNGDERRSQTAPDIAYLEGFRQGSATVWNLTVRLHVACGIIVLMGGIIYAMGVNRWTR